MKIIVALTLLLVLINPSIAAVEEAGTGVNSIEPIVYCVSLADEGGSGITYAEDAGTGVSSSNETEDAIVCVIIN